MLKGRFIPVISFLLVISVGIFFRTYLLSYRPLHNDEAVNNYFLEQTVAKGYFPYSHENYHGPSYFYITLGFTSLLGDSEWGIRSSSAVFGLLTIISAFAFFFCGGWGIVLTISSLIALSPSLIYYSRYAIHETLFLFSSLWVALSVFRWFTSHQVKWIYIGFVSLAVLISTKETFIITLFSVFFAFLSLNNYRKTINALSVAGKPLTYGGIIMATISLGMFSGGFQWVGGLWEMVQAVPQWISRNDSDVGHFKPFFYYCEILLKTEPYLFLSVLLPFISFFPKISHEAKIALRFFSIWGILSLLVYSYVSYKTPWLIINITLPLIIALGLFLHKAYISRWYPVWAHILCLIGILATSLYNASYYNFYHSYGDGNPYSYVHTSSGMREVVSDIETYWKSNPDALVLVGVNQYWPLPYYLRNKSGQVHYVKAKSFDEYSHKYDIIILDKDIIEDIPGWGRNYYRLSEVQESQAYFRRIGETHSEVSK